MFYEEYIIIYLDIQLFEVTEFSTHSQFTHAYKKNIPTS